MSATEPTNSSTTKPTTESIPKKEKKQLTAEQIRQRRKKQAALRRQRILNAEKERLNYVKNRGSVDEVHEAEKNPRKKTDISSTNTSNPYMSGNNNRNIRDVFNQRRNPFMMGADEMNSSGFSDRSDIPIPNMTNLPPIDPNMNINDMMSGLFDALGADSCNQTMEEIKEKREKEEEMIKYDQYTHNIFCILFVILLVFLPYKYDVAIFNYSLSSDAWTFFIALEIILFSIFYGYKQYLEKKYNPNPQQTSGGLSGGAQLMSMFGANIGASMMGGNEEMSKWIQKWINRVVMLWSYIKMLRQLISDLCLVLFLWIVLTSIKTVLLVVHDN